MEERESLNRYIVSHLDEALEKGWIEAWYQPVIRTTTGCFAGAETLARWRDPVHGMIMPGVFVPALEEAGLIWKVDCRMLTQTAKIQRDRLDLGLPVGTISGNLSRQDFDKIDVVAFVEGLVREYQLPKELISLEITESVLVQNKEKMTSIVKDLRAKGFRIWMDDFGSGYSSLIFLNDYTLDVIKLDMGFLRSFSKTSMEIMKSTVSMAKTLGIRTLAEGVEKEEHVQFLKEIGCDMMQGYFFAKPMPDSAMPEYVRFFGGGTETIEWKAFYDRADACIVYSDAPMAILEYDMEKDHYHYLYLNQKEREQLWSIGRKHRADSEFVLNSTHHPLHRKLNSFTGRVLSTWERCTVYVADNSFYVRIIMEPVVKKEGRCILKASIANVTEVKVQKEGEIMSKTTADIALLFDDVHVLNPGQNTADNLINNFGINAGLRDQDDLRKGLANFRDFLVHPEDKARYWAFADPDTMIERLKEAPDGMLCDFFRVQIPKPDGTMGPYRWEEFNILIIPGSEDQKVLSCIKTAIVGEDRKAIEEAILGEWKQETVEQTE